MMIECGPINGREQMKIIKRKSKNIQEDESLVVEYDNSRNRRRKLNREKVKPIMIMIQ